MAEVVRAAAVLVAAGVELVVVGGAANWLRGDRSRPVKDLDVVPSLAADNVERLLACCDALGAPAKTWPTAGSLRRCDVLSVPTSFGPIDLLAQRSREEFPTLRTAASLVLELGVPIPVASPADIDRLKRRYKDLADV